MSKHGESSILANKRQFMSYDPSIREIILKFETIKDINSVKGLHLIWIEISDSKSASKIYQIIVDIKVPKRKQKVIKKQKFIDLRN